jgi:hypothetical protein
MHQSMPPAHGPLETDLLVLTRRQIPAKGSEISRGHAPRHWWLISPPGPRLPARALLDVGLEEVEVLYGRGR